MNRVYLVRERAGGQLRALKQTDGKDKRKLACLRKEASFLNTVRHPLIPACIRVIDEESSFSLLMEYVEGQNLQQLLEEEHGFELQKILEWGLALCRLFAFLHSQGITYCDLKPSNLLLSADNTLHLVDFGAICFHRKPQPKDTVYLGTKGYAAPELFGGMGAADERSDIYSLGACFYHLLDHSSKDPRLPRFLAIAQKCTAYDPQCRFQSFVQLEQKLLRLQKRNRMYLPCRCMAVVLVLAVVLSAAQNRASQHLLRQAAVQTGEACWDACAKAFHTAGLREEVCERLFAEFRKDGCFSLKEEAFFTEKIAGMLHRHSNTQAVKTAYDVALLYWYCYQDEQQADICARPWFLMAAEENRVAASYMHIADFERKLATGDPGTIQTKAYAAYWEQLMRVHRSMQDQSVPQWYVLQECRHLISVIEDHGWQLWEADVGKDAMEAVLTQCFEQIRTIVPQLEKERICREQLLGREALIRQRFENIAACDGRNKGKGDG